ncbi:IS3 family transposase, partial [Gemmatimonadota bacterium]
ESRHALEDKRLLNEIKSIYLDNRKVYGCPRIHDELRKRGIKCGRKRVARLMREDGIHSVARKKFKATTDSKHKYPVADNVLNRRFEQEAPNRVWVADITFVWTREGWLYLAALMDLFSRMVVGWAMDERITRHLVISALRMAVVRRKPAGVELLHHSDRGSQYASGEYQKVLAANEMRCSMSRRGNCYDNSPMESFFGTLKKELIYLKEYQTRDEARQSIFEYIEVFYNRRRSHSTLGNQSPSEYERSAVVE